MSDTFTLPFHTISEYYARRPDWGPVGEIVYKRTYEHEGEGWAGTCKRVVEMCYTLQMRHCKKQNRPWSSVKALASALEMYDLMFNMKFLPPGRGLDCGRIDLIDKKGGAVLNNCGFVSTKGATDAEPFCWAMDMLALGVGVGFDTLGKFRVHPNKNREDRIPHRIEDSREGWVAALQRLLNHYFLGDADPEFDYSEIRPEGEPLKTLGGVSSGPGPLRQLFSDLRLLLGGRRGYVLSQPDIADIFMLIGRCIVSGNKRRSAELGLGTDISYMRMKEPKDGKFSHPWRWAANLSVIAKPGGNDWQLKKAITDGCEVGVFWLDNARRFSRMGRRPDNKDSRVQGTNPCSEQSLEDRELCCLVEVFPSRHKDYYDFQHTLKYAYLYAKSITLAKVHDPRTNEIIRRNRRIGCSLSGIVPACNKFGRFNFLNRWMPDGYKYIQALDDRYSAWFNINRSIKTTSVKPSGTVSKLPGVAPGVHWPHAEYYYQVIRFNNSSPYVAPLRDAGYKCFNLVDEPNTVAVYFPIKEENFERSKDDISLWEQMEFVAQVQHQWSDNQVSATITYSESERKDLGQALELYASRLKSATFFPREVTVFEHAPMQKITKQEYDDYVSQLDVVTFTESNKEAQDKFCDGEVCEI